MTRHLNEDDCLDLLHGLLVAERQDTLLEHVSTCPDCERMFAAHAAHAERVRARGELRLQPDSTVVVEPRTPAGSSANAADTRGQAHVIPFKRYFRVAAVAATAAAVILIFFWPGSQQLPNTTSLRELPGAGELVHLRGEPGSATDKNLEHGIEAYTRRDLSEATDLLRSAKVTGQWENLRRIYLGNALARLGDFKGAVGILESVPFTSVPDPWSGEGRWTLYVSYATTGQASEAEALLNELSREPGPFGDRARDALGQK